MIYFVRHGATDWNEYKDEFGNKAPKCQGLADLELNSVGIEQAKQTAKVIAGKKFDRVICSPLKRARQTCEIIYNGDTRVEIDKRVIERDFGEFEGLTRSQFDFYAFWNANKRKEYEKAESLESVEKRAKDLFDELKANSEQDVLIVSHGGFGCVFASLFGAKLEDGNYLSIEMPHGKPLLLNFDKNVEN